MYAKKVFYPLPLRIKIRGSNQRRPDLAADSQLCASRWSCYVGRHNASHSRRSYICTQYNDGRKSQSNKDSKMLPILLHREAHFQHCGENPKSVDDLADAANLACLQIWFFFTFCSLLKRNHISYWAKRNKNLPIKCSRSVYCAKRGQSTMRMMCIVRCGTDLIRWTLRFSLSLICIRITLLRTFAILNFTQWLKAGPGLPSTHYRKTNYQQPVDPFRLKWP